MENSYDYKRFAILYVDDEEMSLKAFARAFEDHFRILTAPSAQEGFALLEKHQDDIGILMTDQRMPGEKGVWLLEKARDLCPRILRILATAYTDTEAVIAAVNSGAIYKYVTKPWNPVDLEVTLLRGLEFFLTQQERDQLLREKMSTLRNLMIADHTVRLGLLAAGMSHHIRNSLVAVKTFLELAPAKMQEEKSAETLRNPDFWKDYHHNVQQQIEKIDNMLKDLWAAGKKPSAELDDQVHLRAVVDEVIKKLAPALAQKNLRIENHIPADLSPLVADGRKFFRLFELLFNDELVSLPPGSVIRLSGVEKNGQIQVEVRDNGPGLPQEAMRLVFDPFALRSDTPTEYGINLMACFFIVHHHGGTIEARSEGQGTTFVIRLPINPSQPLPEESNGVMKKVLINDAVWEKLLAAE